MAFTDISGILSNVASAANIILIDPKENIGITAQVESPNSVQSLKTTLLNFALPSIAPTPASPKFLFHYNGEETVSLNSDITDHYVEDNSAIQDQVSLKPEQITVTGYIGELNNVPPNDILKLAKTVNDKLGTLAPFVPQVTATAAKAYNTAVQVYSTANLVTKSVASTLDSLTGGILPGADERAQNKQQKAFTQFYNYWQKRTLFKVQTPWCIFDNMAILSLKAEQDEETQLISTFEITFKKMRFAKTKLVTDVVEQGRREAQASLPVNLGNQKGLPAGDLKTKAVAAGVS